MRWRPSLVAYSTSFMYLSRQKHERLRQHAAAYGIIARTCHKAGKAQVHMFNINNVHMTLYILKKPHSESFCQWPACMIILLDRMSMQCWFSLSCLDHVQLSSSLCMWRICLMAFILYPLAQQASCAQPGIVLTRLHASGCKHR